MIIQVINLSNKKVFKKFIVKYNIYHGEYSYGLFGLEIRNLNNLFSNQLHKNILKFGYLCYKTKSIEKKYSDIILLGSIKEFNELAKRIISEVDEETGLAISKKLSNFSNYDNLLYNISNKSFDFSKAYTMGILNATPDSFSDGGKYLNPVDALEQVDKMVEYGVDIIDIGGESTRPGAEPVTIEDEINRVIPIIKIISTKYPKLIISIDTTKKEVACKALELGCKIVNDISALTFDPAMVNVIKNYNASLILMHIKGKPKNMQENPTYFDVVSEVYDFLEKQAIFAKNFGIDNIIIDPGIGFGKTLEHNLELIERLEDFKSLGYPILIGLSRKSFLGKLFNLDVDNRDDATSIAESFAIKNGARIIRTHNLKNASIVCKFFNNLNA